MQYKRNPLILLLLKELEEFVDVASMSEILLNVDLGIQIICSRERERALNDYQSLLCHSP